MKPFSRRTAFYILLVPPADVIGFFAFAVWNPPIRFQHSLLCVSN
ncbi:MAG TPA: hypothetical protein VHK01_02460 [Lacipirellulaceae bacterium]|jgi:hypothetical protein|nr:hypothetical protein [Lacipirellulaceae bacterium]